MHAHRVQVLDRTDNNNIIFRIPHDLELIFLPPDDRLLDQDLVDHTGLDTAGRYLAQLVERMGKPTTGAAQGKARTDNDREPYFFRRLFSLRDRMRKGTTRHIKADLDDRLLELLAVFGFFDDLVIGAEHRNAIFLKHPCFV